MLMNTWQFHMLQLTSGGSRVGHLRFFCLHRITCLSIPTVTLAESYILLEIFRYLHFDFCVFVWLIKLKCTPHLSHH